MLIGKTSEFGRAASELRCGVRNEMAAQCSFPQKAGIFTGGSGLCLGGAVGILNKLQVKPASERFSCRL